MGRHVTFFFFESGMKEASDSSRSRVSDWRLSRERHLASPWLSNPSVALGKVTVRAVPYLLQRTS